MWDANNQFQDILTYCFKSYSSRNPRLQETMSCRGTLSRTNLLDRQYRDRLGPDDHGIAGLINLYGIESPGMTSSLAIADYVKNMT